MIDKEKKAVSLIGIAKKAGKVITGTDMTVETVRIGKNKVKLLYCSADASETTVKRIKNTSEYYKVPFYKLSIDKSELARITGNRYGEISVIGITDEGFAKAMIKSLSD